MDSIASWSTPNLAKEESTDGGGGREPVHPSPPPASAPNREESVGKVVWNTVEVETESSSGGKSSSSTRAAGWLAATANAPITKLINKNNDLITINMGLKPSPLPQHPNNPSVSTLQPNTHTHPQPVNLVHTTPIHTAITNPTPTTPSLPKFPDPEKTCDVRGVCGNGNGSSGNSGSGADGGTKIISQNVLFSVGGGGKDPEDMKKTRIPPKMMTNREKRLRRTLVEEARSHRLKVGNKTSDEIMRMLSKEKRTQPRMTDLLHRKEETMEEEEEKVEDGASHGGAKGSQHVNNNFKEELVRRREENCLEPGRGEEGGNLVTFTIPVSVKPSAKMGETFQEGGREAFECSSWESEPGPSYSQRQAKPSLEEACDGRDATGIALENCQKLVATSKGSPVGS